MHHVRRKKGGDSRIIIDLNLGEERNLVGLETKSQVTAAVSGASLHTWPVLDLGHHDIDDFADEMIHVFSSQITSHTQKLSLPDAKASHRCFNVMRRRSHIGDGLQDHARDMQVCAVFSSFFHEGVNGDALQLGHIAECDGFAEKFQSITTTRTSERSVFVVRRVARPFSQAGTLFVRLGARGVMGI